MFSCILSSYCRATKGVGVTQPTEWQDAGIALENSALQGCHMPKGTVSKVSSPGLRLLYNEVYNLRILHHQRLTNSSSILSMTLPRYDSDTCSW